MQTMLSLIGNRNNNPGARRARLVMCISRPGQRSSGGNRHSPARGRGQAGGPVALLVPHRGPCDTVCRHAHSLPRDEDPVTRSHRRLAPVPVVVGLLVAGLGSGACSVRRTDARADGRVSAGTSLGSTATVTAIPGATPGSLHRYRIDWTPATLETGPRWWASVRS